MNHISKISNVFLVITLISFIVSIRMILKQDLFYLNNFEQQFELYVLIAIPILFTGITATLKIMNKALTTQSISMMKIMADSKSKEKK